MELGDRAFVCARVEERGTRFLERKLCKELYTAVAGLDGGYDIEKRGNEMGLCADI